MVTLPIEIQLQIFDHVSKSSRASSSLANIVRLSKLHRRLIIPLLYKNIKIQNANQLQSLSNSIKKNESFSKLIQNIFIRGPQGKRLTGKEMMLSLDSDDDEEDTNLTAFNFNRIGQSLDRIDRPDRGIEGEGQEATIDEIETFLDLCTSILRSCSSNLRSIGFIDCIPWFMTPADYLKTDIQLPSCNQFTGVTMGTFGLLPYLHHTKGYPKAENLTFLKRVHLIGADFGSFALQRALPASPTRNSLTHLHITAPTLYKLDHHDHLVKHIKNLLENCPQLSKLSVGILTWYSIPPSKKKGHQDDNQFKPIADERLENCRQIYESALPQALESSERKDVRVKLIEIPFVQGSPFGFADWIMRNDCEDTLANESKGDHRNKKFLQRWLQRDLTCLPDQVNKDGIPSSAVWDIKPEKEWQFSPFTGITLCDSHGKS